MKEILALFYKENLGDILFKQFSQVENTATSELVCIHKHDGCNPRVRKDSLFLRLATAKLAKRIET